MAFKRALWHSGLTYQQTCYHCRALVRYTDYQLDFRPWYPDGFVYCPRCKGPLRHNELYAINPDGSPVYEQPVAQPAPKPAPKLSPCPNWESPLLWELTTSAPAAVKNFNEILRNKIASQTFRSFGGFVSFSGITFCCRQIRLKTTKNY